MLIQELYLDVAAVMLEPAGFNLGVVTDAEFLQYYRAVMEDFLSKTGLYKGFALDAQMYGQSTYDVPDWIEPSAGAVYSDGVVVHSDYEDSIASADRNWRSKIGVPRSWRQDKLNMKMLALFPAPITNYSPLPAAGDPYYGVISAYVPGGSTAAVAANIGTMVQASQVGTFSSPGLFFGSTNLNQFSRGCVGIMGSLGLFTEAVTLSSPIEHLTDDWVLFIKYGILAKIFGSDGETRDVLRERFAKARYSEGIMLGQVIMGEAMSQDSR